MIRKPALRLSVSLGLSCLLGAGCSTLPDKPATSATKHFDLETAQGRALYLNVIEKLTADGKPFAALAHLEEYEHTNGREPATLKLAGDAWLSAGRADNAEDAYRKILSGPLRAFGEHGLGNVMALRGDWKTASKHFGNAAADQPTHTAFLSDLGYSQIMVGAFDEAEITLRKAFELDPKTERNVERLLLLLVVTGRTDEIDALFNATNGAENLAGLKERAARLQVPIIDAPAGEAESASLAGQGKFE